MTNILARKQAATLHTLARQRVLLAFDFDGTLAPIVDQPGEAAMRARTAKLLTEVARLYPCVVISGRGRADVMAKVAAIPLRAVFGNHGMEPARDLRAWRRQTAQWHAQLAAALPPIAGLVIENKGVSLAVHFRQARAHAAVRSLVLAVVADLRGTRIVEGKMVVNILPAGAPNKGTALIAVRNRLRCQAAIYVGDDDNDEDVFVLPKRERVLGIRVGRSRSSQAAYFVSSQAAVDHLLVKLLDVRKSLGSTRLARPSTGSRPPAKPRPTA